MLRKWRSPSGSGPALAMCIKEFINCQCWSASFELTSSWSAHEGIVLSSIVTRLPVSEESPDDEPYGRNKRNSGNHEQFVLVTGANDGQIKVSQTTAQLPSLELILSQVWEASPPRLRESPSGLCEEQAAQDTMLYALSKFISIPSVSKSSAHREDCRQAAIWLRKCLTQLGAEASLVCVLIWTRRSQG